MHDLGYLNVREPFKKLITQGMVLHKTYKDNQGQWVHAKLVKKQNNKLVNVDNGLNVTEGPVEKMSKSKLNVVDIDDMLNQYSADCLRMFSLSDSPVDKDLEWSDAGIEGCQKFLSKLALITEDIINLKNQNNTTHQISKKDNNELYVNTHTTIKEVTNDIKTFSLNKAIARIRQLFNLVTKQLKEKNIDLPALNFAVETIIIMLNPFTPHICEELWQRMGHKQRLYQISWPDYDETFLPKSKNLVIQVNGKLRANYPLPDNVNENEIKDKIIILPEIQKFIKG